jgi:CheY-like chemotaxis protein
MPSRTPPLPSSPPLRVALLGFTAFERRALESYFRLAAEPAAAFEAVDTLAASALCVVASDTPAAVDAVRRDGRIASAVFVGARAPDEAVMHLQRPIDPQQVARALQMLAPGGLAALAPVPAARRRSAPPTEAGDPRPRFEIDVLLVDDAGSDRQRLQRALEALGCRVSAVETAAQASTALSQRRYRMLFAGLGAAQVDGLALCQQIKQRKRGMPAVVLIGARDAPSDRVRSALAGGDAYLATPLDANELLTVLREGSNRRRRPR